MHTSNLPYSQDVWLSYASVKHWVDCATPSSGIADAAMLAASSLPPTTTIPAISAHRGAHTMKMITNHLGFSRRRAQTHQGFRGALQTSSLRVVRADRSTAHPATWVVPCSRRRLRPASRHGTAAPPNHTSPLFPQNELFLDLTYQLAAQLACRGGI